MIPLPHPSRLPLGLMTLAVAIMFSCTSTAHAISHRTLLAPSGEATNDELGVSVASAGDVNGDGYADVIAGAPYNSAAGAEAGRAYVHYGGPAADAVPDLVLTGVAAGDYFGYSVASAGDVNGDGYADLIVGANRNASVGPGAGAAYVFYGGPAADATPDLILTGVGWGDNFGYSVASAGDVNGDGFADLIVGALYNDAGGPDAGRAYVYYGGPAADATPDLTLTGAAAGDNFGVSVAPAGDVNGDGFADLIVGGNLNDEGGVDAGRAYVYYGGPVVDATPDLVLTGVSAGDWFGRSVAPAGDVDGDGFADLIVGAPYNGAAGVHAGRAYVYYGGPAADANPDLVLTGAAPGDALGWSAATAGDINADGNADLIVGAPYNSGGGFEFGRAYVHYGGPAADTTADLVLTGAGVSDLFGNSVASAGDVDGDGFADLIVGALYNGESAFNAGRAYVFAVYPYQLLSPNGGEQWVAGRLTSVRWLGHDVADLAISFDGGASWSTLRSGVGGAEENEVWMIIPGNATDLARMRVSYSQQPVSHATSDLSDAAFRIVLPVDIPPEAHRPRREDAGGSGDPLDPDVGGSESRVLAAWPLPYRGGELNVAFGISGAVGASGGVAEVGLYDLSGRLVRTLARGSFTGGSARVTWDGRDERGADVPDGTYFLRSVSAGVRHRLKVVVIR